MELLLHFIDIFLHLDKYLGEIIRDYGAWTYLLLLLIVFCETGLVVTPILPGDSLLFAAGAFAARGDLDVLWLLGLLIVAAFLGDTVNYWVGNIVGPSILQKEKIRFIKKEYLIRTQRFYERHGGKTIVIARFMPIIRTFAPFLAGIGRMHYPRFLMYNITGGVLWVAAFVLGGYYFGNIPFVRKNFTMVILVIVFISISPAIIKFIQEWMNARRSRETGGI